MVEKEEEIYKKLGETSKQMLVLSLKVGIKLAMKIIKNIWDMIKPKMNDINEHI